MLLRDERIHEASLIDIKIIQVIYMDERFNFLGLIIKHMKRIISFEIGIQGLAYGFY